MEKRGLPASTSGKLITNPMEVGVTNRMEVGVTNRTEVGVTNRMEVGVTNLTEVGVINPTVIGMVNPTVRKAIDALQRGEVRTWLSLFVRSALLYDHGNAMTAGEFIEKSAGREYFTRIDRTGDLGMSVFGSYHTVQWGDFLVRFRFELMGEGRQAIDKSGRPREGDRICRLDVSQVAY